ncbi:hypothetical protein [Phormidesmis priestleyi]|uniref:hypothetical protein n=1 Tax=Phormidesmis priestleyi TaxID=268141 RepID=UPI0012E94615|nr:hypothetical protein [Phormidesmis priestleyi]
MIANTNTQAGFMGAVLVDATLNPAGAALKILFSNQAASTEPGAVKLIGGAEIHEVNGGVSSGPISVLPVTLKPMEIQILGRTIG